jgi:hypothetical protein
VAARVRHSRPVDPASWLAFPDYDPAWYDPRCAAHAAARLIGEVAGRMAPDPGVLAISAMTPRSMPARRAIGSADASGGPPADLYTRMPSPALIALHLWIERAPLDILDFAHRPADRSRQPALRRERRLSRLRALLLGKEPNWLICVDATQMSANTEPREITITNLQQHRAPPYLQS